MIQKTAAETLFSVPYVATVLGTKFDPRFGAKKLYPHCVGTSFWPKLGVKKQPQNGNHLAKDCKSYGQSHSHNSNQHDIHTYTRKFAHVVSSLSDAPHRSLSLFFTLVAGTAQHVGEFSGAFLKIWSSMSFRKL